METNLEFNKINEKVQSLLQVLIHQMVNFNCKVLFISIKFLFLIFCIPDQY